ncbi:MAG: NapC/NirT family cytochrome c, partial [Chloroflexota bacterium]
MERKIPVAMVNPVSLLGAAMAAFSLVIVMVLLVLGATGAVASPYTGILTFLMGPMALALGLMLIPIGIVRERRRLARLGLVAKTFPILDLNDVRQRRGIVIFATVTAGILSLMAVTTYGAAEFMETKEFCGDLCHRVMVPESAAYEASSHARVSCVSCHIGPGAPWLVKSKISGIRQVFNYGLERYERPIEVPIQDLRPSRDTCEQCHRPERFYGDLQRNIVHFAPDEQNTPKLQPMIFRVGGSAQGEGIHWHTTAEVYYLPLNESRSEIGWVRVEKPDGTVDEFVLPDKQAQVTPERIKSDERFMDCIDCHNRAAHNFAPYEEEVDRAMLEGTISPRIPFIKQQAAQAVGKIDQSVGEEQYQATLQRLDGIEDFYRTQQTQVYAQYQSEIKQAVAELKEIYQRTVFPHMQVTHSTYPDWMGHDGCLRCHGKLV